MEDKINDIKKDIYAKVKCKALTRKEKYDKIQEKLSELNDKERTILLNEFCRDYSSYDRLGDMFQWITVFMTGIGIIVPIGIQSYNVLGLGITSYLSLLKIIALYIIIVISALCALSTYRSRKLSEIQYLIDIMKI